MELWQWAAMAAAIVVVAAVLAVATTALMRRRRRTEELTARFGPAYRETLEEMGDRRRAEDELEARERRVAGYDLRPLTAEERDRFEADWRAIQARFVDDPAGALARADGLVNQLLEARGYPGDAPFDDTLADLTVEHGRVTGELREARATAERHAAGGVDTEQLRRALVHYRSLVNDLLQAGSPKLAEARS